MFYYIIKRENGRDWYREASDHEVSESVTRRAVTKEEYDAFSEERTARIYTLLDRLAETDYIACKIAEGASTAEEYADMLVQRAAWRREINELRGEDTV